MKEVDKRPHYVGITSLSVIVGNYVLARVCQGGGLVFVVWVSVRCLELRGVRFSEVQNVLVLW